VANLQKKLNRDGNTVRLSFGVVGFVMIGARFVTKWGWGRVLFSVKENEKRRRNGIDREWDHVAGYNFNITDGFTDEN